MHNELNEFSRSERLLGVDAMEILKNSSVAIFGIGGVGSYVAEVLARSGIGHITLIDSDTVGITNINRQLIALHSTLGRKKVDVMKERIMDINPNADIEGFDCFYDKNTADLFELSKYDYIVDAIDTVKSKILLIERAIQEDKKIISSMGTGNKLDPMRLEIMDIYKTEACPLARVMRKELKSRGIKKLKVLSSKEVPVKVSVSEDLDSETDLKGGHIAPASVSFVPSAAGIIIGGEVVKDIIKMKNL